MNNLTFNIKRFLANKNTVTILGVMLGVFVLYLGYNWRVQQAIRPTRMPYAIQTIQPRTRITENMIGYADVPPRLVMGNIVRNPNLIIGKYANYNTVIPEGSLFFQEAIVDAENLPDAALMKVPEGFTPFNLPVNMDTSYGNSIFPGNYINLYLKALNEEGRIMVGMLAQNIEVLAVKDRSGKHVFENTATERVPHTILFAVPEEFHLTLRKALYLRDNPNVRAELFPVPNTEAYTTTPGELSITSTYLRDYILINTGDVPVEHLPDAENTVPETPNGEEE